VFIGDVVSLWATALKVGRTSITVHVEVRAQKTGSNEQTTVTQGEVVMVATDGQGKAVPIFG
jgi:acyl-CoA thioesterase YciA